MNLPNRLTVTRLVMTPLFFVIFFLVDLSRLSIRFSTPFCLFCSTASWNSRTCSTARLPGNTVL